MEMNFPASVTTVNVVKQAEKSAMICIIMRDKGSAQSSKMMNLQSVAMNTNKIFFFSVS